MKYIRRECEQILFKTFTFSQVNKQFYQIHYDIIHRFYPDKVVGEFPASLINQNIKFTNFMVAPITDSVDGVCENFLTICKRLHKLNSENGDCVVMNLIKGKICNRSSIWNFHHFIKTNDILAVNTKDPREIYKTNLFKVDADASCIICSNTTKLLPPGKACYTCSIDICSVCYKECDKICPICDREKLNKLIQCEICHVDKRRKDILMCSWCKDCYKKMYPDMQMEHSSSSESEA